MLTPQLQHPWNLSPTEAIKLQRTLVSQIRESPLKSAPKIAAGADCAFSEDGSRVIAGWVVWDILHQREIESATAEIEIAFPYVPGLLTFREAPALIAAAARLKSDPEVLIFDGHGRAHPRRIGIASHMGLLFDRPSIGCAKSRLCGEHKEPGAARGSHVLLVDGDERIGRVLRTRTRLKPVYVSVGHRINLDCAVKVILQCCTKHRLPEPARLAHLLVTRHRNGAVEKAR